MNMHGVLGVVVAMIVVLGGGHDAGAGHVYLVADGVYHVERGIAVTFYKGSNLACH